MSGTTQTVPKPANGTPEGSPHGMLAQISRKAKRLPNRVFLYANEKWGKTSFAAQVPDIVFLKTRGEDGLDKLMSEGILGEVNHLPGTINDWLTLKNALRELFLYDHPYRAVCIDTIGGAERLCFEHVCREQYSNDWTAFANYGKGVDTSRKEWIELLEILERCRIDRNMGVLLLAHARVKRFNNPTGSDFDRYIPDMQEGIWGLTHKWADMILFGAFDLHVSKDRNSNKVKAAGGQQRILYTERTAAFDAGNRHNLPPEINLADSATESWKIFTETLKKGRDAQ